MSTKRYVLLDRDGTIIVNKHYQKDPALTELLPHAREGLDALRRAGFGLVLISNQSGVGRRLMTSADVEAVNRSVAEHLGGGEDYFAGVYYCPHVDCDACHCRKPLPGLAKSASKELGFSLSDCYMVGDREIDVEMGRAAGAVTILVRTGGGRKAEAMEGVCPDFVADDLLAAAEWILAREASGKGGDGSDVH